MKVLITGAGGFIGSHLVDSQLEQGHEVRAVDLHLDRIQHQQGHPRLEAIQGDLLDEALVKKLVSGVEVVYHLASAHLDVRQSEDHYRRVNVDATLCLVEAAHQAGVKRFVHCSSVGVMGHIQDPPAGEDAPCRPNNIYGKTKLEGEKAVLEYARRTGFPLVVIRPAWVYGPRCPRTEKMLRAIGKGRFPVFGRGDNMRHPVYISDAVKGLELSAEAQNCEGEVYIIAGSAPVRSRDLIAAMSAALGASRPKIFLPLALGMWAGRAFEIAFKLTGRQPPFSRRSLDFFQENNAYDIRKARQGLGYSPEIDLHAGFQKTIQWKRDSKE